MAAVPGTCGCSHPVYVGPSLEGTCGGGSFVLFMSILDNFLRSQCDVNDPCGRVHDNRALTSYDFVVIGGGSAGAAAASRLSEIPNWNVLLLEAGGDEPPGTQVPALAFNFHDSEVDWNYYTEPETKACLSYNEKRCKWTRGKVLGGSSVLNGMMYIRGQPRDYDKWAESGIPGWGYLDVLPYFKKSENNLEINEVDEEYHSVGGPLTVTKFPYQPPITEALLRAGEEMGYPRNWDLNGRRLTGFAIAQTTSRDGTRMSSARAFLRPVRHRRNLHVMLNSTATKILIDGNTKQVNGVEFIRNGRTQTVRVTKEVVVSAGAVNSPQLLLLSGIGPKEDLARVGVPLVHDLPGVGKNLHNHVGYAINFIVTNDSNTFDLDWAVATEYLLRRKGPLSSTGTSQITGKINSPYADPSGNDPDIQYFFYGYIANCARTGVVSELMNEDDPEEKRRVNMYAVVLRPKSRGYLTLKSSNPLDYPLIYANYLSDPADIATLIEAIKFGVKFGETRALKDTYGLELDRTPVEGCEEFTFASDEYWECAARQKTEPENHQVGSCSMGPEGDPNAVVDPKLRVQGIRGLRVADTSVIPAIVSGNTNAPAIMIADRLADMIKDEWAPQTVSRFGGGDDFVNTVTLQNPPAFAGYMPNYYYPPYSSLIPTYSNPESRSTFPVGYNTVYNGYHGSAFNSNGTNPNTRGITYWDGRNPAALSTRSLSNQFSGFDSSAEPYNPHTGTTNVGNQGSMWWLYRQK